MIVYTGKLVLAPMVRAGELPTRLLALQYGADLIWTPEIIDKKLIQCERKVNEKLNTIDYVIPSKTDKRPHYLVFRTYPKDEQGKLIFQMGTASPSLAVAAALKIIEDVDGIDINAGCPKHFSVHSGMGAALLKTPDILCSILEDLVSRVGKPFSKPISVKIRILDDEKSTLELVERLCSTGISNLTVHCRTTPMRNRESPIRDYLPKIYEVCKNRNVSLIMNGAIRDRAHFKSIHEELNLPSDVGGMIAENAEVNASVFNEEPVPWHEICKNYIKFANQFENNIGNTKYMLNRIVPGKSEFFQYFIKCKTLQEIDYVAKQLGPDGTAIEDPSEYLNKLKEDYKKAKKEADDLKSRLHQTKKHSLEPTPENIKNKRVKGE